MVSATIAADGQTVTIPISGAVGSLSPTTAITGFTVNATQGGNSRGITVSSATASGTTVTLTLALPVDIPANDAVTVTLATSGGGSNLTDTLLNTPAGQSNFSTTNNSSWYAASTTPFSNSSRIDGGILDYTLSQYAADWNFSDGKLRFIANASQISICVFHEQSHWVLLQDGVQIFDWGATPNDTNISTMTAVTGLSGTHTYEAVSISGALTPEGDNFLYSVQVIGSLGAQPPVQPLLAEGGDSLVALQGQTDSRNGHLWLDGYSYGFVTMHPGASGAEVYQHLDTSISTWFTGLGQAPKLAIIRGGGNDIAAAVDTTTFQGAWATYIANTEGVAQPPTNLIAMGIINSVIGGTPTIKLYDLNIASAAGTAGICYVDIVDWLSASEDRQGDGLHLNNAGEIVFANKLLPITAGYMNGASYFASGPASGLTGQASGNFTVNIATGASWTGLTRSTETITVSDGGGGGTFTTSLGDIGVGTVTSTPTVGTSSYTFTYTPGSTGAKTITLTSGQSCWKNPSALLYSSNSNSAGQNIVLVGTSAVNSSFPAVSHTAPVEIQFELANWSNLTINEILVNLTGLGMYVDVSDPGHFRFNNNWETGQSGTPSISTSSFTNGYMFVKYRHDNAGALGPAKTDYIEAWDQNGVLQYSNTFNYTGDNVYAFGGVFVGHDGNKSHFSLGFVRASTTTFTPLGTRSPATADVAPYAFQWKFDGNLSDDEGLWNATYDFGSPSYESTLYQYAFAIVSLSTPTWRAGYPQTISAINSYSQSNVSSSISQYFWQATSANPLPVWTSHAVAAPTLSGLVAGDYGINLQIIDGSLQTATTTLHVGVVATDNNDIVINSSGIPPNSVTDYFLGPMMKWESPLSAYPLFDVLHGVQSFWRTSDFQGPINGGSSYQSGVAYFDFAQPGTLSMGQSLYVATGTSTNWITTVCNNQDATDPTNPADFLSVYSSTSPGIHTSDTFNVTSGNNAFLLSFNGGPSISGTVSVQASSISKIAADMQAVIKTTNAVVAADFNGFLLQIKISTPGINQTINVQTTANSIYGLLGIATGTYTNQNMPQDNIGLVVWYPTSSLSPVNPAYSTGRRQLTIKSCISSTTIIAEESSGLGWRLPTVTNVSYSLDAQAWPVYYLFSNNGNYYDAIYADYYKAIKSGVASDLAQARARADRWFRGPGIDMGQEFTTSNDGTTFTGSAFGQTGSSRNLGMAGVMLRATDGQPNYWTGINYIENGYDIPKLEGAEENVPFSGTHIADLYVDQREFGYALIRASLCAMFDTDAPTANACRYALVNVSTSIIVNSLDSSNGVAPYFPIPYWTSTSFVSTFSLSPSSACVTNGSRNVHGSGTIWYNFPFNGTSSSTIVFFSNPAVQPANNLAMDTTVYFPVFVDTGDITLDRNYTGTTGCTGTSGSNKGWALADANLQNPPYNGYGSQPFIQGLMAEGMALASLATKCVSAGVPTNCDNTTSANLQTWANDAAVWISTIGYDPATQGVYQGAGYVNCTPASGNTLCNSGNLPYGERVTAQEADGGIQWSYRLTGSTNSLAVSTGLYNAAWANSGGLPDYNPPSGQYVGPGSFASIKYYGLLGGVSLQPSVQAVTQCKTFPCISPVLPAINRALNVGFNLPPNATSAVISLQEPNNYVITSSCTVSPCQIVGDARQGTHLIRKQYCNSSGTPVVTGDWSPLGVQ